MGAARARRRGGAHRRRREGIRRQLRRGPRGRRRGRQRLVERVGVGERVRGARGAVAARERVRRARALPRGTGSRSRPPPARCGPTPAAVAPAALSRTRRPQASKTRRAPRPRRARATAAAAAAEAVASSALQLVRSRTLQARRCSGARRDRSFLTARQLPTAHGGLAQGYEMPVSAAQAKPASFDVPSRQNPRFTRSSDEDDFCLTAGFPMLTCDAARRSSNGVRRRRAARVCQGPPP